MTDPSATQSSNVAPRGTLIREAKALGHARNARLIGTSCVSSGCTRVQHGATGNTVVSMGDTWYSWRRGDKERDMTAESKLAQQEQISSTTASSEPEVHRLTVENYSLGGLDFAKPALTTPVTPLQVQGYTLAPLAFSAPGWGIGIGCLRVSVDLGGRPPDIPADAKERMVAALVVQLTKMQTERPSRTLYRNGKVVMDCARELARKEKVITGNRTLREQIVNLAFERWQNSEQ
jgi:hypothetical protein